VQRARAVKEQRELQTLVPLPLALLPLLNEAFHLPPHKIVVFQLIVPMAPEFEALSVRSGCSFRLVGAALE